MNDKLLVSSSPHLRAPATTQLVMLDVIIALVPAGVMGTVFFGPRAALLVLLSVLSAVASEALTQKILKRPVAIGDLSAVVTGMLLAYNLPPSAPLWLPVMGSAVAIVLVKQIFGGLGHNFMNPALAARAILLASFMMYMTGTAFTSPVNFAFQPPVIAGATQLADAVSGATPLRAAFSWTESSATVYPLWTLLVGNVPGCVGETSKIAILVGAAYLLIRRVISWRIPAMMVGTALALFVLRALVLGQVAGNPFTVGGAQGALAQILSGGLLLGACFMATDYSTSPVTPVGQLIFGAGCGVLVFLIRAFSPTYPEGASYAILLMNLVTPLIDRYTRPRVYGEVTPRA